MAKKQTDPTLLLSEFPGPKSVDSTLSGDAAVSGAHQLLKKILSRHRGEISRVEKALGYSKNTIWQWRTRGNLDFRALVDMLRETRYSPISFFGELFRTGSAVPDADAPCEDRTRLAKACAEADELRHTDPVAALGLLNSVHHLSELAPALYAGSAGSIFRVLQMSKEAGHFLTTALVSTNDAYSRASTYRRLAPYALYCQHDPDRALVHATNAISLFQSIGATFDSRASAIHTVQAYYEQSLTDPSSNIAHDLLAWQECPPKIRLAAHQILGLIQASKSQQEEAVFHLESALYLADSPLAKGTQHWSLAHIAPSPSAAEPHFAAALRHFGTAYGFQTINCTIEKIAKLGISPTREFRKLASLNFDCDIFNTFAENLLSATELSKDQDDYRKLPSNIQSQLNQSWTAHRQRQARLIANNLLSSSLNRADL